MIGKTQNAENEVIKVLEKPEDYPALHKILTQPLNPRELVNEMRLIKEEPTARLQKDYYKYPLVPFIPPRHPPTRCVVAQGLILEIFSKISEDEGKQHKEFDGTYRSVVFPRFPDHKLGDPTTTYAEGLKTLTQAKAQPLIDELKATQIILLESQASRLKEQAFNLRQALRPLFESILSTTPEDYNSKGKVDHASTYAAYPLICLLLRNPFSITAKTTWPEIKEILTPILKEGLYYADDRAPLARILKDKRVNQECAIDLKTIKTKKEKDRLDVDYVNMNLLDMPAPKDRLKTHILVLRNALSSSYGMYVGAMLCETTFMCDPTMLAICGDVRAPFFPIAVLSQKDTTNIIDQKTKLNTPGDDEYEIDSDLSLWKNERRVDDEHVEETYWNLLLTHILYNIRVFSSPDMRQERQRISSTFLAMFGENNRKAMLVHKLVAEDDTALVQQILKDSFDEYLSKEGVGIEIKTWTNGLPDLANSNELLVKSFVTFTAMTPDVDLGAMRSMKSSALKKFDNMSRLGELYKEVKAGVQVPEKEFGELLDGRQKEMIRIIVQHAAKHIVEKFGTTHALFKREANTTKSPVLDKQMDEEYEKFNKMHTTFQNTLTHVSKEGFKNLFRNMADIWVRHCIDLKSPAFDLEKLREEKVCRREGEDGSVHEEINTLLHQYITLVYTALDPNAERAGVHPLMTKPQRTATEVDKINFSKYNLRRGKELPLEFFLRNGECEGITTEGYAISIDDFIQQYEELWGALEDKWKKHADIMFGIPTACGLYSVETDAQGYPKPQRLGDFNKLHDGVFHSTELRYGNPDHFIDRAMKSDTKLPKTAKDMFDLFTGWCEIKIKKSGLQKSVLELVSWLEERYRPPKHEMRPRKALDYLGKEQPTPGRFRGDEASSKYRSAGEDHKEDADSLFSTISGRNGEHFQLPHSASFEFSPDTKRTIKNGPVKFTAENFVYIPQGLKYEDIRHKKELDLQGTSFNVDPEIPKLYSMLDAHAFLYNRRHFYNPADCNRKENLDGTMALNTEGQVDHSHYWVETLAESFLSAREEYATLEKTDADDMLFEEIIKYRPSKAFPSALIGELSVQTRKQLFPLLPERHVLWDKLRRVRAMDCMWAELPSYMYRHADTSTSRGGAWMPLSVSNQAKLYKYAGLFDETRQLPSNPWFGGSENLSHVYSQSSHSVYKCTGYTHPAFSEWQKKILRYRAPDMGEQTCYYPFTEYGGDLTRGDFTSHKVCKPQPHYKDRHNRLVVSRFGMTGPLRIPQTKYDTGLLQDLFSFSYRDGATLTKDQREVGPAEHFRISPFTAYARNHAVLALACGVPGTPSPQLNLITKHLFRTLVDAFKYTQGKELDEGVPICLGFKLNNDLVRNRPVTIFASSIDQINQKIMDVGLRSAAAAFFNEAALAYGAIVSRARERRRRDKDYNAIAAHRPDLTKEKYYTELLDLKDMLIDHQMASLVKQAIADGADLKQMQKMLDVRKHMKLDEDGFDENLLPGDMRDVKQFDDIKKMDFTDPGLTQKQLAVLNLLHPDQALIGMHTTRDQSVKTVNLEHMRERVMKEAQKANANHKHKYVQMAVMAEVASKVLAGQEHLDFLISEADRRPVQHKDPIKESKAIPKNVTVLSSGPSRLSRPVIDTGFAKDPEEYRSLVESSRRAVLERMKNHPDESRKMAMKALNIPDNFAHIMNQNMG
jgi:hypothetical protein